MSKKSVWVKLSALLVIVSFLLVGCKGPKPYDPGNDNPEPKEVTFGFSDEPVYKNNIISDKETDKKYDLYVFITDGTNVVDNKYTAENVEVSLIDIDGNRSFSLGKVNITNGYGVLKNLSSSYVGKVQLRAEGKVIKKEGNSSKKIKGVVGFSNVFWIRQGAVEYVELMIEGNDIIKAGTSETYKAKAKDNNGNWKDVTQEVNWYISDTSIAVLDTTTKNKVTGCGVGQCQLVATYQGLTATLNLTVERPNSALKSIIIAPANARVYAGETVAFTAYGIFAEYQNKDIKINITNEVTWSTADSVIATIDSKGVATGISPGVVEISAIYKKTTGSDHNMIEGKATLTVIGPPAPIPESERLIWEKEVFED